MLLLSLAFLAALILSALFSGAETALLSLGEARVRVVVDEGFRGSAALARLRSQRSRLLVLVRLGNTLANVGGALAAGYLALAIWDVPGLAIGAAAATLLILLLGELLPMSLAIDHSLRIALAVAPFLLLLFRVLNPLLVVLERIGRAARIRSVETSDELTEREVRQLAELGETEGVIEAHERQLIERAFRLDETKAWDIMTPRVDVFAWQDSLRLSDIAPQLHTIPYSRVPVYGDSVDDITGVLYLREAYQALVAGQRDVPLRALAREPLIVPGSVPLTKLLRDFQGRRIHLAVVVDEYGGTDGLVTLEDVLEELVGEIVDETDVAEEPIQRVSRNEILAAGDADLREINHVFNTAFPQLEHRSLNGYLLDELGRVPKEGEVVERDGVVVEVVEATDTQVRRVRLRRTLPVVEAVAPASELEERRGESSS